MKYFDKNNWYIEEASLTDEQFVNVCKYLVENYSSYSGEALIEDAALGLNIKYFARFDTIACVDGRYGSFDLPNSDLDDCTKITYKEFEKYLLNNKEVDNEGWIEWGGGECPVDEGTLVDVVLRNNRLHVGQPAREFNRLGSTGKQIIKYRLHKPSEESLTSHDTKQTSQENLPQSLSERLVSIQRELLDITAEVGSDIRIHLDEISVEAMGNEWVWVSGKHDTKDLQKLLDGIKMIKEFEDEC